MKPRRVIVTLEIDTEASLVELKNKWRWRAAWNKYHDMGTVQTATLPIVVDQVSVNVVKQPKQRKKSK